MNTLFLHVVLTSTVLAGQSAIPTWKTSYNQAQREGATQRKPLAVFFGTGSGSWSNMLGENAPAELKQLLSDKFVCVHIDTANPAGKKLASDFGITEDVGVVLSDITGAEQAFWHQGNLSSETLTRYVRKYGDPTISVTNTETVNTTRTSLYPDTPKLVGGATQGGVLNGIAAPGYCPNCNGGGRRR
jgi:hypothetical protein